MTNMVDGLGGEEVNQTIDVKTENISGTNVYGTLVKGVTISGTDIVNGEGELQSVSVGSPSSVYGAIIQAGSGTLGAGSNVWQVYPTTYAGQPAVVVTGQTTVDSPIYAGSIGVGSFIAEGKTASDEFSWVAIGL